MNFANRKNGSVFSLEQSGAPLPLVSVIVPIYDVEPYLSKCVDSVLAQTYKNFELLLIDDGSPDRCGDICDQYAARDERVRAVHQENQGLSAARNTGLDAARGEYLFFIDSDDSVDADFISSAMEAILRQKADVVCFGYRVVTKKGRVTRTRSFSHESVISNEQAMLMVMGDKMSADVWSKTIKRELFDGIRFPVGRLSECNLLMPQIFDKAQKIVLLPTVTYNYLYPRKGSICTESTREYHEDVCVIKEAQLNFIAQAHPELISAVEDGRHAFSIMRACWDLCPLYGRDSEKRDKLVHFIRHNTKGALQNRMLPLRYKIWLLLFSLSPKLAADLYDLYHSRRIRRAIKEAS